jgi:hypothetical protein
MWGARGSRVGGAGNAEEARLFRQARAVEESLRESQALRVGVRCHSRAQRMFQVLEVDERHGGAHLNQIRVLQIMRGSGESDNS